jgi:hypothetical protein
MSIVVVVEIAVEQKKGRVRSRVYDNDLIQ